MALSHLLATGTIHIDWLDVIVSLRLGTTPGLASGVSRGGKWAPKSPCAQYVSLRSPAFFEPMCGAEVVAAPGREERGVYHVGQLGSRGLPGFDGVP